MAKVFGSFVELVESNKGLFEKAKKNNQMGICEAIWNSRTTEVSQLQLEVQEILSAQKMLKAESALAQQDMKNAIKKHEESEDQLSIAQRQLQDVSLELETVKAENADINAVVQKSELLTETIVSEKDFLLAQIAKLENELKLKTVESEELMDQVDTLTSHNCEIELDLKEEILKSKSLDQDCHKLEDEKAKVIKAYKIMKAQAEELDQLRESHEMRIEGLEKSNQNLEIERNSLKQSVAQARSQIMHFQESFEIFKSNVSPSQKAPLTDRNREVNQ
ncbi:MAG: hypothetical protein KC478_12275 [Bacteriovoracaceae bacterium]|nr:hypothetical protein [Bacteriovoracaceae bacterium]